MGAIHNTQHIEAEDFAAQTEEREKRVRRLCAGVVAEYRSTDVAATKAAINAIVDELVLLVP